MLPTSGAISINDIEVELGISSGTENNISDLLDLMTTVGGSHSAHSFRNAYGYAHGNIRHYMQVIAAVDMGIYIRMTVQNYQTIDSQSGVLYWSIYDDSYNVIGIGNTTVSSVAAGSTTYVNCSYSGIPVYAVWGWSLALKANYIFVL